jgi:hypothetical protein
MSGLYDPNPTILSLSESPRASLPQRDSQLADGDGPLAVTAATWKMKGSRREGVERSLKTEFC